MVVAATVATSAVVLCVAGAVTYWNAHSLAASIVTLGASNNRSDAIERVVTLMRDAETGQRGFLLTQRESYLEPYTRAAAQLPEALAVLHSEYAPDRNSLSDINQFAALVRTKNDELARTIALQRAGDREQVLAMVLTDDGKRTMDAIRALSSRLQAHESLERDHAFQQQRRAGRLASESVIATTALSVAILAALLYVFRRDTRRVRASEERLATTLRSIGDAVIATDGHGCVELMNPVASGLTGWTPSDAYGKPLDDVFRIVNEDTRAVVESPVAQVLRAGTIVGLANHTLLLSRDGREIPIEDSAAPIAQEPGGVIEGVVLVFRDATEKRETARALREADRRKDEFLAVLAHELRNPLAPIRQAAYIARSKSASAAQLAWCQAVIDRQVGHMARLLDDLLDVSRITRGKLEVRKSRVEVSTVFEAAVEIARPLIDSQHHTLTTDLPAQKVLVDVDPLRLAQVIANLLTNAAKYTAPHGRITLSAQVSEGQLVVRVTDNGRGIRKEDLSRIFEMFYQVGSPITEGGLGIGLALAKGLTELHGGTIEARSEGLGKGSEFILTQPVVSEDASAPSSGAREMPVVSGMAAQRPLRIVVADDNRDAAITLATTLELDGHSVEVTHSGDDALKLIESSRPDIALLDIGMPVMDGYEVARRIREQDWSERLKLVAVTGWGQVADRERAQHAGFDHHWVKPIEPRALVALCASMAAELSARSLP